MIEIVRDVRIRDLLTFVMSNVQEQEFLQKQQQDLDIALKKIIQHHKHELATIERDCLNHKQQLLRGKPKDLHQADVRLKSAAMGQVFPPQSVKTEVGVAC